MHFSGFNDTTGIAGNDSVKCPYCKPDKLSHICSQWYHDSPAYRNKSLCKIALPPSTKYNTTHSRHTIMDTKFHHSGVTHCLGHSDLNEMCQLWVTVTNHLQVMVTLDQTNSATPKEPPPLSALVSIWIGTGYFPLTGLHTTNDHPTRTFHPTPGYAFALLHQEGLVPGPYTSCKNHSKITFHIQLYLSQQFWPSSSHPDFWAQYHNYPAVTQSASP